MIYDILPAGDDIFVGTNKGIYKGKLNGKPFMPADISVFPGRDIVAITIYKSRLLAGLYFKSEHWMFSSDNFGKSWEIQAHEFSSLWDLFVNGDRLWACRSDGLWYLDLDVWTDIGTPPTQPAEFKLSQNYPNPFNPTTTIKYSIPSSVGDENFRPLHMVTLKVYDILGSEAETLVNELKAPGNYKVEFDATNLAGGIYFYQLRAGNFSDVKKFILLK
ncbi:MAG: T9SS type A sorting domain-containing protein [Melioribacteraceae bacterium]|nr:T9SS type A sorting domain-containing protein [Melioribacteraceae bacterium]MCF8355070.1 T9SS type A sorting domain-containing protein [Melioribacteraceae bacterium]MCF8395663.1 T9SS type A sorting domain-containing protein [Melioribacteraceae bacterium]MCF8420288.1 T9SS type A sorting domain-containing protein [Melioribacteraceae bacterium]